MECFSSGFFRQHRPYDDRYNPILIIRNEPINKKFTNKYIKSIFFFLKQKLSQSETHLQSWTKLKASAMIFLWNLLVWYLRRSALNRIRQCCAFDQLGKDLLHPFRFRWYTSYFDSDRWLGKDNCERSSAHRVDDEVETSVSREAFVHHPDERGRSTVTRWV